MKQRGRPTFERMSNLVTGAARNSAPITCAFLLASVAALPGVASADTVYEFNLGAGSIIAAGSPSASAFCTVGSACPGTAPADPLSANDPLTGTITYDATTGTVSYDLSLTANANFGSIVIDQSSQLIASGLAVSATTQKSGSITLLETGSGAGNESDVLSFNSGTTLVQDAPIISGLQCSISSGFKSGSCGFLLSPTSTAALAVSNGGTTYDGALSVNVQGLTPVPLPASLWLLLSGFGALGLLRKRGGREAAAIAP
jgi:hypothetical protein